MKKSLGPKTLIVPAPVWCVGTYDAAEKANVMTVAWGGICCSKPPCVTVSLRKATYSFNGILERKAYTLSVPSEEQAAAADYFGMVSGRERDKFADTGLTAARSESVEAPFVAEFPMVVHCRLVHHYELGLHTHFVGEIVDVQVDEALLDARGLPDMEKIRPVVFSPEVRKYYGIGAPVGRAFDMGRAFGK
jgi:flavin reductase (DIM6/NTAB) family NADH-FMN oxidoreductase RutF